MIDAHGREIPWRDELPAALQALLDQTSWETVMIGRSGMQVFHIGDGYLKIARQKKTIGNTLSMEKERLQWLQGQLPVPQVYYYGKSASFEYLYLSEVPGVMACDQRFQGNKFFLIDLLAEALHMVHAIDPQRSPFVRPLQPRLDAIQQKITSGSIDYVKFALDHHGLAPQAWYEQLEDLRPITDDLVFTHGDFCLPNILIDPQKRHITGLIDWGLAGVADRHEDLDAASWSLGYNFDPAWIPSLRDAYGLKLIDPKKLAFYQFFDDLSSE